MLTRKLPLPMLLTVSLLAVCYYFWISYHKPLFGIDDANIYFVYMRNFAEGHGFVWTVGGERVEGFSSLLWTLIGAACYKLSPAYFPALLFLINFLLTAITTYQILHLVRKLHGSSHQIIAATDLLVLALLLFPLGFVEWHILTLMETGLWFFLMAQPVLMLCNAYLKGQQISPWRYGLFTAALVITRPEGLLFGLLLCALVFLQQLVEHRRLAAFKTTWPALLCYALAVAGLLFWRLSYFGYPFPNTYYAKVSSNLVDNTKEGIRYFFKFVYSYPHLAFAVGLLLLSVLLIVRNAVRRRSLSQLSVYEKIQLLLSLFIIPGLLLPVLTGGDHFKYNRFYQFFIPFLLVTLFNAPVLRQHLFSVQLKNKAKAWALYAVVLFALFFLPKSNWIDFGFSYRVAGNKVFEDFDVAQRGRMVAELMNRTFVDQNLKPSTGVIAAGGFAYAYKGETVDLMGLNNTKMAHADKIKTGYRNHASFNIPVFWTLTPDIVGPFYGADPVADTAGFRLMENNQDFRTSSRFLFDAYKGIFDTPRFRETYYPALVRRKGDSIFLLAYYHRRFLQQLTPEKFDRIELERKMPKTVNNIW